MATVIYNGIQISHVQTNSVSRQPVLSESNEYLFTHVTLDISGIISPETGAYGFDEDGQIVPMSGESAASTDSVIRHSLLQPRCQLVVMMVDGEVWLVSPAQKKNGGYYSCDCNSGPIPKLHSITRIDGDHCFRINFSVETWIRECNSNEYNRFPALVSNRFTQTHSIDSDFMTTITTTGQAFFRTDILDDIDASCDTFRGQCLPPVPLGFNRTSIQCAVTLNRNALTYNVVDRQAFFDIGDTNPLLGGSGVTSIEAQYSASTIQNEGGVAGGQSFAEMAVKVRGAKESSLWLLSQKAFTVAGAKLPLNRMPQSGILSHLSISQNMTGRDVVLRVQMLLPPSNVGKLGVLNSDILRIDDLFGDSAAGKNPSPFNDKGSRGSYNKEIFVAKLKAACKPVIATTEGGSVDRGTGTNYSADPPIDPQITYTDIVPAFTPSVSYDQIRSFMTDYKLDYLIKRTTHTKQLPIAKNPYESSANPGSNSSSIFRDPNSTESPHQDSSSDMPITPDCEIVHLAYPTSEAVVTWTAERVGEPPKYPSPFGTEENFVLIEDKIQPASPELSLDGVNYIYRITGAYTFALRSARGSGDKLPTGALPLWDRTYEESYLDPKYATTGIIGPKGSE